ncbi:hypothetical protein Scep_005624 [Stephania cephalantha]|uniref:HP domain-containing protein n=1 Tax=Stephania cephalantha TaxID=152367 RepID=A0AAP0KVL1_9MAGN
MSRFGKGVDPAFDGAGAKAGLEVWCIESRQIVPVPKPFHGKFFSGSVYIILNTALRSGILEHDIHYWLGNAADEVDSVLASDKAFELDAALGSHAVQYREIQGEETEKFLSYFKPCIIPASGKFSSGRVHNETYRISLLTCKGDHVAYVKEVPFSRSSLNHNDVFIADTASKIFLFSGCNSSMQERAKALEVVQYIKESKHGGKCELATIEDGKFVGDPDVGEFWSLFGGYAPITKEISPVTDMQHGHQSVVKLFWITLQGKLSQIVTDTLRREVLDADKCYLLDCDTEIYVWMGRTTSLSERKISISTAEEMLKTQGRSTGPCLTFLTEGTETAKFKSFFDGWPQTAELNLYEEGRGKVAAIFKHQGFDVKELPEEDYQPSIDCSGTLKVWRVNGNEVLLLPVAEQNKLFSADCYIVHYRYLNEDKDEHLFYAWLGSNSIKEDRDDTVSHMSAMIDSIKGHPVMAQIFEGKEPVQFYSIFQKLVVFKGGWSSRYKKSITERGIVDETYVKAKASLFRVQGTDPNNMQAIQVDLVSGSLNSSYCYILQTGASVFTWLGNLSSQRDHDLLDRALDLINSSSQPTSIREGSEPDVFWNVLRGKAEYSREKETKGYAENPHLFTYTSTEGNIKVKEIFNFTQDDLTTEDLLILDCQIEIYVWMGNHANVKSKQQALTLGMKYLELDVLGEGPSLQTPVYIVTEGHEPPFFTCHFVWDSSKMNLVGNSFERKLALLKGQKHNIETPKQRSWQSSPLSSTSDRSRSKSVGSDGAGRSVSPASYNMSSNIGTSNRRQFSSPTPVVRKLFSGSPDHAGAAASNNFSLHQHIEGIKDGSLLPPQLKSDSDLGSTGSVHVNGNGSLDIKQYFPYNRLKLTSDDPATGIDVAKREAYLTDEEFQEKFGMTKQAFYKLPKWRQNKQKMTLHLF